jgi:hypothetical protein
MFSSNVKDEIPEDKKDTIKHKEDEECSKYDDNDGKKIYNMDKSQEKKAKNNRAKGKARV